MSFQVPLGYVPISSSALRPLGAAYIPILLSEVEHDQRPSGNEDREPQNVLIIQLSSKKMTKPYATVFRDFRRYFEYSGVSAPDMGGLVVSSASLLALPAFAASAFGASHFLTTATSSDTSDGVSFTRALEK